MEASPQKSVETAQDAIQSPKKEAKTHWSALEPVIRTMKVLYFAVFLSDMLFKSRHSTFGRFYKLFGSLGRRNS